MARTFARKGHAILAVARREERLVALSQEMAEKHQGSVAVRGILDKHKPLGYHVGTLFQVNRGDRCTGS